MVEGDGQEGGGMTACTDGELTGYRRRVQVSQETCLTSPASRVYDYALHHVGQGLMAVLIVGGVAAPARPGGGGGTRRAFSFLGRICVTSATEVSVGGATCENAWRD